MSWNCGWLGTYVLLLYTYLKPLQSPLSQMCFKSQRLHLIVDPIFFFLGVVAGVEGVALTDVVGRQDVPLEFGVGDPRTYVNPLWRTPRGPWIH